MLYTLLYRDKIYYKWFNMHIHNKSNYNSEVSILYLTNYFKDLPWSPFNVAL